MDEAFSDLEKLMQHAKEMVEMGLEVTDDALSEAFARGLSLALESSGNLLDLVA